MLLVMRNQTGESEGTADVSDAVFACEFKQPLVHQVVTAYLAGGRQGTRAQKNRSAVRGGGRKPWRQKGTGRARAGTIRSPLWRGGGRTFPASNQDFSQKVNKKMYRGAIRSILSELARRDLLVVVDRLDMTEIKTSMLAEKLTKLGLSDVLILASSPSEALLLSARNLPHVEVRDVSFTDPVSLIRHEKVMLTADALKILEARVS